MTLFIVSIVKAESSAVNSIMSIFSSSVISTLVTLAVAIQTLGLCGIVYLAKNNKDITSTWTVMFLGIVLRPLEWVMGSQMIK